MKKIVYIGILFLALVATSCTKEDIVTVANDSSNAPTWDNSVEVKRSTPTDLGNTPDEEGASANGATLPPVGNTPPPTDDIPVGEITDPNNDPDGKKRKP